MSKRTYKDTRLIDKALSLRIKKQLHKENLTQAEIDLAFAFLNREVTARQLCHAMGGNKYLIPLWFLCQSRASINVRKLT